MKKIFICVFLVADILCLFGCRNKTTEPQMLEQEVLEENVVDFEEYDLIDFIGTKKKIVSKEELIEGVSFVHTDYIIQNKSDKFTISNLSFDYLPYDSEQEKVLSADVETEKLPIDFNPREKAEVRTLYYVGKKTNPATSSNNITTYSYELNGLCYIVNRLEEKITFHEIKDNSNVDFEEKNILAFNGPSFTNNSDVEIKSLTAEYVEYNEENIPIGVESSEAIKLGDKTIAPHEKGYVSYSSLVTKSIVISSYIYETGAIDENGYNHFEINLLTGEAIGSTNNLALDSSSESEKVNALNEFEVYINSFGKKIDETDFKVDNIEKGNPERIYLGEKNKLINQIGTFALLRDYDTLRIIGFEFVSQNTDQETQKYILDVLINSYGKEYGSENYSNNKEVFWDTTDYRIKYEMNTCTITATTDFEKQEKNSFGATGPSREEIESYFRD